MNMTVIPIAIPIVIPSKSPISNPRSALTIRNNQCHHWLKSTKSELLDLESEFQGIQYQ